MSVSINGTSGVTFSDSSTQASAAILGVTGQAFTSSGTFTIPTGVTAVKVTVVGGGGGGAYASNGTAGGTSSFASYASATGGGAGTTSVGGAGGVGSLGTINWTSGKGGDNNGCNPSANPGGSVPQNGTYDPAPYLGYIGNYGVGGRGGSTQACGGGGGGSIAYVTGLIPGGTVTVTVGGAGTNASGSPINVLAKAGIVVVEW